MIINLMGLAIIARKKNISKIVMFFNFVINYLLIWFFLTENNDPK